MEQAVLLWIGKNYLFFSHGTVLMYLLCVFLVYRRWITPYRSLVSAAQRWRTVAGRCDGRGVCRCISAR